MRLVSVDWQNRCTGISFVFGMAYSFECHFKCVKKSCNKFETMKPFGNLVFEVFDAKKDSLNYLEKPCIH